MKKEKKTNKRLLVSLLGVCLVFLLFSTRTLAAEDQIFENITKFIDGLDRISEMEPEEIRGYLLLLADSILLLTPHADIPQDIQNEMKASVDAYINGENEILQEGSVESLWKAARFINPDFGLDFPGNATPDLIKEDAGRELQLALSFKKTALHVLLILPLGFEAKDHLGTHPVDVLVHGKKQVLPVG